MARLTGPLLSQEARKKLAGLKVYQNRLSRSRVIKYSKPYQKNPANPSPGQLNQRMIYNLIIARWQTMTDGEKAPYIAAVSTGRLQMSPWNYFLKEARRDLYTHLGLAGYWSFNRIVSGKVLDLSGNGNDGTPNPSYPDNCPQLVPGLGGKFGQAMAFDGIDDYVNCGNDPSLDITDAITIEAWVKTNIVDSADHIIVDRADDTYSLWLRDDNSLYGFIKTAGGWNCLNLNYTPTVGVWYHTVVTYKSDGSYATYLNGEVRTSGTVLYPGSIVSTDTDLGIGSFGAGNWLWWNGSIDEVRIYDRALGVEEIKAHYEIYSKHK